MVQTSVHWHHHPDHQQRSACLTDLSYHNNIVNDLLTATVQASDPDGTLTYTWEWSVDDGSVQPLFKPLPIVVPQIVSMVWFTLTKTTV